MTASKSHQWLYKTYELPLYDAVSNIFFSATPSMWDGGKNSPESPLYLLHSAGVVVVSGGEGVGGSRMSTIAVGGLSSATTRADAQDPTMARSMTAPAHLRSQPASHTAREGDLG